MRLIFFPHRLGQTRFGVDKTPAYFKKITSTPFVDVKCNNNLRSKEKNLIKNLKNLYIVNSQTNGKKINIGGDHSMAIGTVADSLNRVKQNDLKLLWFDAHPDINTYNSSETKNFHGMPLAFLSGLCKSHSFNFISNTLNLRNILYIGIRSIDSFEQHVIQKNNISYISCEEANNNPEETFKKINSFIQDKPIHLSFDVDCMDPEIIPCTGTKVKNGLLLPTAKFFLDRLHDKNIVNMDITELNLCLGKTEDKKRTIQNVEQLFQKYLSITTSNIHF